jgi:5-methylcytosine-specific restriction endonuclease McrA
MPSQRPSRAVRYSRRRRRRIAAKVHDLTDSQWTALKSAWGGCAYCGAVGRSLQKDCVLPISRGGRYALANVVPCCRSCNTSKCNTEVTSWMRRKKLDEGRFLLRQAEINRALAMDDATAALPSAALHVSAATDDVKRRTS